MCVCDFSFCLFDRSSIQLVKWSVLRYYYRVGIHEWIPLSLALACVYYYYYLFLSLFVVLFIVVLRFASRLFLSEFGL